jgi:hypothetical protein
VCPISAGDTHTPLGVARRRVGSERRWLCWFARPVWEICEREDDSLLMTIHGAWLWSGATDVFDAEPRHVGCVQRGRLVDSTGLELAQLERLAMPGALRFVSPQGLEFATVQFVSGSASLCFRPILEGEPFLKMLVLAATLACHG